MYKDYSIEDKINFLKKIQNGIKFKQDILAKSLPDNFVSAHTNQVNDNLDYVIEQISNEAIKELSTSDTNMELIDTIINQSIEIAKLSNKNITGSLLLAQSDLIKATASDVFTNPKFLNEISSSILTMVAEAFLKGMLTTPDLIATNDAQKTTEHAIKELIKSESYKKSRDNLLHIIVSTSQNNALDIFSTVMENIISNINTPD